MAQQKHFTLEEVIPGGKNYKKLQPQNMHLQWHGNKLVRIEKNTCAFYNGKGQWEQLFSLEEITSACKISVHQHHLANYLITMDSQLKTSLKKQKHF